MRAGREMPLDDTCEIRVENMWIIHHPAPKQSVLKRNFRARVRESIHDGHLANTRLGHAVALTQLHSFKAALAELNETVFAQREILERDPERQVVEQDLLDALLALGKVQMATGDYDAATRSLSECIAIARKISSAGKAGLYEERYLALANFVMRDLGAELATRAHGAEAARYRSEAGSHYADALAIWSRWRSENLAKAYASREEQAVLRSKAALEQTLTVNH